MCTQSKAERQTRTAGDVLPAGDRTLSDCGVRHAVDEASGVRRCTSGNCDVGNLGNHIGGRHILRDTIPQRVYKPRHTKQ